MKDEIILENIGRLLKQARTQQKLSLRELSQRSGVAKSTISRYEAGQDGSIKNLDTVCRALGLDYSYLVQLAQELSEDEVLTFRAADAAREPAGYVIRDVLYDKEHKELIDLYDALSLPERHSVIELLKVMGGK